LCNPRRLPGDLVVTRSRPVDGLARGARGERAS